MKKNMTAAYLAAALSIFTPVSSFASVVIHGTRVIFPSSEKEVTIRVSNEGKAPGLVQIWMDKGDMSLQPDETQIPFVLTPPLFRVEPGKGQTLRMIYSQEPLPQDKESVFWLNLLEVPPKPKNLEEEDINYVQMAFRTRIKVFYRPKQLNTQAQLEDAPKAVSWKLLRDGDGYVLEARNATPYYISYASVGIGSSSDADARSDATNIEGGMIAPGGSERFSLKDLKQAPGATAKVKYVYLNDYGANVSGESDFTK